MTSKDCKFLIFRVVPNDYLVKRVPVGTYEFVHIFGENQVADLRPRINDMRLYTLEGIPKPNRAICSSCSNLKYVNKMLPPPLTSNPC